LASVVDSFFLNFDFLTSLRHQLATRNHLLVRALILFLFLGAFVGTAAANTTVQTPSVTTPGPGLPFAIADFDGDLRPDMASVQAGANIFGSTEYWVQLQLSAVGRQSIRLVGPAGGLSVEARDVNGDHAVDLVFVTAWSRQPVAILLNDGHGSFSRAEPSAFSEAFSESTNNWASISDQSVSAVGVPPQSRAGICAEARALRHTQAQTDSVSISRPGHPFNSFLVSHAGRAPPFEPFRS
jgi:hypothetical protein